HAPQIISVGLSFLAVEVASRDALRRAKPDAAAFERTFPCDGSDAVYLYTRDVPANEKPCELQARMFHPGASGLSEDPATGSATAAAAALLADLDATMDGELKLKIWQGVDMGRPSLLLTRVRKKNGARGVNLSSFRGAPIGANPESISPSALWLDGFRARASRAPE